MRTSHIPPLVIVLSAGAISLPLMATAAAGATAHLLAASVVGRQQAELSGPGSASTENFGSSVAISGSDAIVGASQSANGGTAYIFAKGAKGWTRTATLTGTDTVAEDGFGSAVAISGTTAVVGAWGHGLSGRAYVFTKTSKGWKQAAELKGSDTAAKDYFGDGVAISGATIVVGAPGHAGSAGRAYVFTKSAKGWAQAAELKGSDTTATNYFGISVSVSGTTIVVGGPFHADAGRAYVFTKTAKGWKQAAELKGSDTAVDDNFGKSVAISGTNLIVGAEYRAEAGRAYVFTKTAKGWKQAAELKGSDTAKYDLFGVSVAISGATVVVGASDHASAGRAYVFTKTAKGWKQAAELKGSDTTVDDSFGSSVGVSGVTAIVGARSHGGGAGRAYIFRA